MTAVCSFTNDLCTRKDSQGKTMKAKFLGFSDEYVNSLTITDLRNLIVEQGIEFSETQLQTLWDRINGTYGSVACSYFGSLAAQKVNFVVQAEELLDAVWEGVITHWHTCWEQQLHLLEESPSVVSATTLRDFVDVCHYRYSIRELLVFVRVGQPY